MKLITETSHDVELWESKSKVPYIIGVFSTAEVKNANGRRYTKNILEREVNSLIKEKINTKSAWGELQHPSSSEVNLADAAILIEKLEWKGTDVYGKARLLDTPKGKIAQELVKVGNIGISSRGLGTVSESGYVNDDFNLITYDLVSDASNPNSRFVNGILEGVDFDIPKKLSLDEAQLEYINYNINLIKKLLN